SEPVARFIERKVETAAALQFGDTLRQLTGFERVEVWVTVNDVAGRAPLRRLTALIEATRRSYAQDLFAFTLWGWALAAPDGPIWFTRGQTPDLTVERRNAGMHAATGRTVRALELGNPPRGTA
ncbi:MAG: hypothetical protein ABIT01_03095, partial [Thermoanaerobaculia bacterium]